MTGKSPNAKKQIKHLRRGLSIYKTGRSPFWHARLYDSVKKKYVVKSTKETSRLDAAEVAEEIVADYRSGLPPLKWSSAMFMKTEEDHGQQETEAGGNCHEVTAG